MSFAVLDDIAADAFALSLTPKSKPKSVLAFSRSVKLPDGPMEGEYFRPETEPAQLHFLRARTSGMWKHHVYVAPSQRGKTLVAILIQWLYAICEERLSVGYVLPSLDKVSQSWEGKIKPAFIGTGYGEWLPVKGPGSKGGRPAALTLTNPVTGHQVVSYFMAAGTGARETALSSVSPARVVVDEADDFESAGHIMLALKRLESWGSKGKSFIASTVNNRGEREGHPVLEFFYRSDATQCRVAHLCPHCGKYHVPSMDNFNTVEAKLTCVHCGVLWDEDDRHKALHDSELVYGLDCLVDGRIVSCQRPCTIFSLLTTGFDYLMADFRAIANDYHVAKEKEQMGEYSVMENFSHKVLCVPYEIPADHDSITDRGLTLRSMQAQTPRGYVPEDADRLVMAIDVQGDRVYWLVMASGSRDRRWIVDHDEWFWTPKDPVTGRGIEPTDADRHNLLNRLRERASQGWPKEDSSVVKVGLIGIDIGYNVQGTIGRWCIGKPGVIALRGESTRRVQAETIDGSKIQALLGKSNSMLEADHGFYEVRKQDAAPDQPAYWWFVKTQKLREHTAGRFRLPVDSDGAMNIYKGAAEKDHLIQHLTSWAIVRDEKTKEAKWLQVKRREDYLDCCCYALAMLTMKPRKASATGKITSNI